MLDLVFPEEAERGPDEETIKQRCRNKARPQLIKSVCLESTLSSHHLLTAVYASRGVVTVCKQPSKIGTDLIFMRWMVALSLKAYVTFFYYYHDYTLSSGVHMQKVQVCYIGTHVPWWFAGPINPSPRF